VVRRRGRKGEEKAKNESDLHSHTPFKYMAPIQLLRMEINSLCHLISPLSSTLNIRIASKEAI